MVLKSGTSGLIGAQSIMKMQRFIIMFNHPTQYRLE
jgi:hypothetical protein